MTTEDGIPCTTVARTLLDLADVVDRRGVERAVEQAEVLRLFDLNAIESVLARANGRRGATVSARSSPTSASRPSPSTTSRSAFWRCAELPPYPAQAVNVWLHIDDGPAIKADFLWRAEKLVIETDGFGAHDTRQAFERDRLRDQRLLLAGYVSLRFTKRQIAGEFERVAETVAALHARRAGVALRRASVAAAR